MRNIVLVYINEDYVVRQVFGEGYIGIGTISRFAEGLHNGEYGNDPEVVLIDVLSSFTGQANSVMTKPYISELFVGYPLAVGGNLRTGDDLDQMLASNCDRVIINTALFQNDDLIHEAAKTHGGQAILPMLDITLNGTLPELMILGAKSSARYDLYDTLHNISNAGIHEIIVRYLDYQGTNRTLPASAVQIILKSWEGSLITTGGLAEKSAWRSHSHIRSVRELK